MRGDTARRFWAAGSAMAVVVAGLAGCTDGDDDGAVKSGGRTGEAVVRACAGGTFTWSGVTSTDRLTGVSEPQRIGGGGGRLTHRMEGVYTPTPSVTAEGHAVSAAEVLYSLGRKIGEIDSDAPTLAEDDSGTTYVFADPKAKAPGLDSRASRVDGSGEFVTYAGVRQVTGDFRYSCADGTTTGHARNHTVDLQGVLACDEPVNSAHRAPPRPRGRPPLPRGGKRGHEAELSRAAGPGSGPGSPSGRGPVPWGEAVACSARQGPRNTDVRDGPFLTLREYAAIWPRATTSATSLSSPTSTTARRPSSTPC
jgi:hypothetical protein